MKIEMTVSDQMSKSLLKLQTELGLETIEDLTIHSWKVLLYLMTAIRHSPCTLTQEAVHWISHPEEKAPAPEAAQESPDIPHTEIDSRILEEIHRLLDDNHIDQALKVTHILKILRSHGKDDPDSRQVKSEMMLTAAETFAAESDPEHAAQLVIDAAQETTVDRKTT